MKQYKTSVHFEEGILSNEKQSNETPTGRPGQPGAASQIGIAEQAQIDGLKKSVAALETSLAALETSHLQLRADYAALSADHAVLSKAFKEHKHIYWVHSQTGGGGELWNSVEQLKAYFDGDEHNLDSWGLYLRQSAAVSNQGSKQETEPPE